MNYGIKGTPKEIDILVRRGVIPAEVADNLYRRGIRDTDTLYSRLSSACLNYDDPSFRTRMAREMGLAEDALETLMKFLAIGGHVSLSVQEMAERNREEARENLRGEALESEIREKEAEVPKRDIPVFTITGFTGIREVSGNDGN